MPRRILRAEEARQTGLKNWLHPAFKLRHTLKDHVSDVFRMALSPDGLILALPSSDRAIHLWDLNEGKLLRVLKQGNDITCMAWSPDGCVLALGGREMATISLWDIETGKLLNVLEGHAKGINCLSWSPVGRFLASSSQDDTIRIWDTVFCIPHFRIDGYTKKVYDMTWSPDGKSLCSASRDDHHIRVWNTISSNPSQPYKGHTSFIYCVAWSPDGRLVASGSDDRTVRIWDSATGREARVLEAHTDGVLSVYFFDSGRLLGSLSTKGRVIIWRTDNWILLADIEGIGKTDPFYCNVVFHPMLPVVAVQSLKKNETNIWDLDLNLLRNSESSSSTVQYVNAKAVLLGDSGVGKSGLGIRMAESSFRPTESTHGAQFWHKVVELVPELPVDLRAELTLWDLAGQPEYRLIHQLFLDDTDAAMLLFDCSDPNEPFRGVPYWVRALKKHAPTHVVKFLVSSRSDVSTVTVDRNQINQILAKYGLDEYIRTSAKTGEGVEQLFQKLLQLIHWQELPRTTTPKLFQVVREFLLESKESGEALISREFIQEKVAQRYKERYATQQEIDTVVALLQARGLVYRLDPRPGLTLVLTRPELINQYASSVIQAARNHQLGIGAIPERKVLLGDIPLFGFERIPSSQEAIVLEATIELLIQHDLCFREMGLLVLPSQINITRPAFQEEKPRTEVAYHFSGSIEAIYASLVVRLSYTDYFRREYQWKYAVEFSRGKARLGFSMHQVEEGIGELEIYFYTGISEFDRVIFIRFITDHLHTKGIDIQEEIRLYCPNCGKEVKNREAIEARVKEGFLDIPCQYCTKAVLIPNSIEERYKRDGALIEKQRELQDLVEQRTEKEVKQFRADQKQYSRRGDHHVHILHLSDLHLKNRKQAQIYRVQLETDLIQGLGVRHLEYLILSGDIADHATEAEYEAAFDFLDGLVKRFGLSSDRIIIVPGNHDVNWDDSEASYQFVPKRKLPNSLTDGKFIPAGDAGILLCNELHYQRRFANFSTYLYKRVYGGQEYPLDYTQQANFIERPEDRILFLGLNSCWQTDHHFQDRKGINIEALSQALDRLQDTRYDGWLKIAVWHHPITGVDMMNNEFVALLAVHRFQVAMHGHVHEAIEDFNKYDDMHGIHIIGAGTFGAATRQQVSGIPLQYNLLTFDPTQRTIFVNTRKKEKPNGAWSADARWGDKDDPKAWYSFKVKGLGHAVGNK